MRGNGFLRESAIMRFISNAASFMLPGAVAPDRIRVIENPTEEIIGDLKAGKRRVKLFARGANGNAPERLEENYLYSTRRFPSAVGLVVPAAPNIAVGDSVFFGVARGGQGDPLGFPTGFVLSDLETNMDVGGQVAQGKNFVFNQIGISFNAEAAVNDVNQLMDAGALRFSKQGTQFQLQHGPVRMWPSGMGVSGFSAMAGDQAASNGTPDIRAVRKLHVPRVLKEKETFAYIYSVPRATKNTSGANWALTNFTLMTIWLWGGQQDVIPV